MKYFNEAFTIFVILSLAVIVFFANLLCEEAYLTFTKYRSTLHTIADTNCYETLSVAVQYDLQSTDGMVLHHYTMTGKFFRGLVYLFIFIIIVIITAFFRNRWWLDRK